MATICGTDNNVVDLCSAIIFSEYDEDTEKEFFAILKTISSTQVDDYTLCWCLNTLNFLATTNINDRTKFILIEKFKLDLLSAFISTNSFGKYIDKTGTDEVFLDNEIGIIYKRYVPNRNSSFDLPSKGKTGSLRIQSPSKSQPENLFEASVTIDSDGWVVEVESEPAIIEISTEPKDFTDIYTDLLSDILKYEEDEE